MIAENVLKVVDISSTQFNPDFIKWLLAEVNPTYIDNEMGEHLYSTEDILEQSPPVIIETILNEVALLLAEHDAGYFRIVD